MKTQNKNLLNFNKNTIVILTEKHMNAVFGGTIINIPTFTCGGGEDMCPTRK